MPGSDPGRVGANPATAANLTWAVFPTADGKSAVIKQVREDDGKSVTSAAYQFELGTRNSERGVRNNIQNNFGIEDEGVESAPCHGEVSRCESGRSRQFHGASTEQACRDGLLNRSGVARGQWGRTTAFRHLSVISCQCSVTSLPRMRTGIDEDTDSKSAAAQHRRGCDAHLIRQFHLWHTIPD